MANKIIFTFIAMLFLASFVLAQTTAFTFQGKLNDGGIAANGTYQFEFKLFDVNGNQVGQTLSDVSATVTNGIFTVNLDFGAASFDGSPRSIEIGVRLSNSGQNYTLLNPRQPIASTPYAIKSLKADNATTANTANDATKLGNVPAAQYTQTNDARLSDARTPTPFSTYYIQNGTSQQTSSSFNISGEGKANVFSATTQFNLGSNRVLSAPGDFNLFVGANTGAANASGYSNSFVGAFAGEKNTTGGFNSFFGRNAGQNNLDGNRNSFFGVNAGVKNNAGGENAFFGIESGYENLTGAGNAFFGAYAGKGNTDGESNAFFGRDAGFGNQTGDFNAFFGRNAGRANVSGNLLAFFGTNAGLKNNAGEANAFFGGEAGMENTDGDFNSFFGSTAGKNNSTGFNNSFFGAYAGRDNISGTNNAFFGTNAGLSNKANANSFFGSGAGLSNINGANNSFFGSSAGLNNGSGQNNSFFGFKAGEFVSNGNNNTFIGALSGAASGAGGISNNTGIGYNVQFGAGVTNSIGIGANVTVNTSKTIKIGNAFETLEVSEIKTSKITANLGTSHFDAVASNYIATDEMEANNVLARRLKFQFDVPANANINALCYYSVGFSYELAPCNSQNRNVLTDGALADAVKQQKTQIEKQTAENQKLQEQIKQQQAQIDALEAVVCQTNPTAAVCIAREKK